MKGRFFNTDSGFKVSYFDSTLKRDKTLYVGMENSISYELGKSMEYEEVDFEIITIGGIEYARLVLTNVLERKLIQILDEADEKLSEKEFASLAESVIDYIDEITRSKRTAYATSLKKLTKNNH